MNPRWVAGLLCGVLSAHPASAEVFLVVAASSDQPAAIAADAVRLAPVAPHGLVVASSDCGDAKPPFLFAAAIAPTADAARRELEPLKTVAPNAHVKPCSVKPGSLLALRVNAVDPSIAAVPKDAVNWTDEDRVSAVQQLAADTFLVIVRRFLDRPNDPLEGRRTRVLLARTGNAPVSLSDDCFAPSHAAIAGGFVAFDCARETAGSHLLHAVEVSTLAGQRVSEIARCRMPIWAGDQTLTCQQEEVGADGKLALRTRRARIERP